MVYNGISCKDGIVICFIMVDNSNDSNRSMECHHKIVGLWDSAII